MKQKILDNYSNQLKIKEDKKPILKKIIKQEKRSLLFLIDFFLTIGLIILILFAQINGYYERDTIVVDCKGDIQTINGIDTNITIEDWMYDQEEIKKKLKEEK